MKGNASFIQLVLISAGVLIIQYMIFLALGPALPTIVICLVVQILFKLGI